MVPVVIISERWQSLIEPVHHDPGRKVHRVPHARPNQTLAYVMMFIESKADAIPHRPNYQKPVKRVKLPFLCQL
jgi:hypothetical protein